jgi:hypothetical protein
MQRINAVHSPHTAKLLRHSDHGQPRKKAAHPEHAAFIRVNSRNSMSILYISSNDTNATNKRRPSTHHRKTSSTFSATESHGKKRPTLNTPHSFALIRVIRGLFLIYHRMTRMQRTNAAHPPTTAKLLRHSDPRKATEKSGPP